MRELEKVVSDILESYKAAVYSKNIDQFVALYANDIHVFDMWGKWQHQGIDEWRKMAEEWFGSLETERVVVDMEDIQMIATPQLAHASATARYTAVSADGQKLRSLQNRFTIVIAPRDEQWKIVHEHTSGPAHHESLKISLAR